MSEQVGTILALAVRDVEGEPMREVKDAELLVDGGLSEDAKQRDVRGVTFIARHQWVAVCDELGVELAWTVRKANVLLDTSLPSFEQLMGTTIYIGDTKLEVTGETTPCSKMDRSQQGLQEALRPAWRGGMFARVIEGGHIAIGDVITTTDG